MEADPITRAVRKAVMTKTCFFRIVAFAMAAVPSATFVQSAPAADSEEPATISAKEFLALGIDDQRTMLAQAFERRLNDSKNISYEVVVTICNHEYRDGKLGPVVWEGMKWGYRHWRLGDSYRVDVDAYGRPFTDTPQQYISSGFDANEGRSIETIRGKGLKKPYARIDKIHSRTIVDNRYSYWLDGKPNGDAEHIIRCIVNHRDQLKFSATESGAVDVVVMTLPWTPFGLPDAVGEWKLELDSKKGFLPVHGIGSWERVGDNRRIYRRAEFIVGDSKLVSGVWMPTRLREVIEASPIPGVVNVWETEVVRIEQGKVTPTDLVVSIDEGTTVIDSLKGGSYSADANGQPVGDRIRPFGGK